MGFSRYCETVCIDNVFTTDFLEENEREASRAAVGQRQAVISGHVLGRKTSENIVMTG